MILYQSTRDLSASAQITYSNMRTYYEHYAVNWEQPIIVEQIAGLENWDIVCDGEVVGAIRLAVGDDKCYLRDLQVSAQYQNQGIGAQAITESVRLAREYGVKQLRLRVFKISPAYHLYTRCGFTIASEDDRFFNMIQNIT
ncbi:GNAT family N-acetyltransferase [Photobacterium piscicola]|uniref:GNAT family N-acetyltransferase n=1 Tax=Photobacterium piscicola TaxID=1378299 RepID=UPI002E19A663|nr:GNAT family N-acetyltransferase [Photobacterium piscicola]